MIRRHPWTWLCLHFLIGVVHPRILFYLNRVVPGLRRSTVTDDRQGRASDDVADAIFDRKSIRGSAHGPATERINVARPEFLDSGYLRSAEGTAAFRKLAASPVLPEYLECQLEGLAYFDRVFRGQDDGPASYGDVMTEHHRILATGLEGKRTYKIGGSSDEHSREVAGKIRPADPVALATIDRVMVDAVLRALTEIEFYPLKEWDIPTDGVPRDAWSRGIRTRRGFSIRHPDEKYIPLYFSRMHQCLSLLRRLSSETGRGKGGDRALLLKTLATYFHLGIQAHAFVRINQSLLWAQVNYVLMLNGFRPTCHGYADLVAAFLDTANFRNYFARHVSANAPESREPGEQP